MQRICQECGESFTAKKSHAKFCCTKCRKDYNNRRAVRGSQLYDVFMAMRYDREQAKELGIDWKFVCRMGELFNRQDETSLHGKSYRNPHEVVAEIGPSVNGRIGRI
jgi:transposase-like protein